MLMAIAAVLTFITAPMAVAQDARHRALSTEFASVIFDIYGFDALMSDMADEVSKGVASDADFPSDWAPLLIEAAREEMEVDRQGMMALFGREFGRDFTEAELEVGIAFFRSSGGRALVSASLRNAPTPQLTRAQQRELDKIMNTPAGRAFSAKADRFNPQIDNIKGEFIRMFTPGFFRRFGEKAEAFEAARNP